MKNKNLFFILTVLFLICQKYELNAQTSKKPVATSKPVATKKPVVSNNPIGQISALKGVDINLFNKNVFD